LTSRAARSARLRRAIVFGSAGVVVVASAAVAYVAGSGERMYGARAELLFVSSDAASGSNALPRDLVTQKVVVRSRAVLGPVAKATGVSVDELAKMVSVGVEGQSDVLRLTTTSRSRETALRAAQAVSSRYVAVVREAFTANLRLGKARLEQELGRLSAALSDVDTRVGKLDNARQTALSKGRFAPVSAEQLRLQAEAQILLQRVGTLQDRLATLELQRATEPTARVLTPAYSMERPVGPRPLRAAAAGTLIGLVLAVGFVALLRRPQLRTWLATADQ
jgi:capsular polysaccharide biosynthesis protein